MKLLPLNDLHERLGARMSEFAGWRMPIDYGSVVREVLAVRERAGLFDISHMGRMELSGEDAEAILQHLTTNDPTSLATGRAHYTLFLNASGGVIDDAVIYRRAGGEFYIIVNAANLQKDIRWIEAHLEGEVLLADWTDRTVFFAVQGPLSPLVLERAGAVQAAELKRFGFAELDIGRARCAVSRTGYTGEDGFEVAGRVEDGERLWTALAEAGGDDLVACGLAARDVLRIEAGYPLYGHEIDEVTNPVEAGLMRFVKPERADFVGKRAVQEALARPQARSLTGVVMDGRWVPRSGDLLFADGRQAGHAASGTFSPGLSRGIALAFIEPKMADEALRQAQGARVEVEIHGARRPGVLKRPPLYVRRNVHAA